MDGECAYHGKVKCMACLALKQAMSKADPEAADGWLAKAATYEATGK